MKNSPIVNTLIAKALKNGGIVDSFYFSDCIHDVEAMERQWKENSRTRFFWVVTECGTHLWTQKEAKELISSVSAKSLFILDIIRCTSIGNGITIDAVSFLKLDLADFIGN